MSRVLKHCSEELRQFLSLERFSNNKRLSEVLAEIESMSPEHWRQLSRDAQGPWGRNDIRAEMEKLLARHGKNLRVRDCVLTDELSEDLWACDLGAGD